MAKKKRFLKEDYDMIKKLLSDNKIDTKKLNQYEEYRKYRWMRHSEQISCTDEQIEQLVNGEITLDDIEKKFMIITYAGTFNDRDYFKNDKGCYVDENGKDIFVPCSVIDSLKYTKEVFTKKV